MDFYIYLLCCITVLQRIRGQVCNGTQTFVKVSGYSPAENSTVLLLSNPGSAVTNECLARCLYSDDCSGILVDYENATCFRTTGNISDVNRNSTHNHNQDGLYTNFFQKICLEVPVPGNCSVQFWPLERVDGFELVGAALSVRQGVPSGLACGQLCLSERQFRCRSAQYVSTRQECSLSPEDRRSLPGSYRAGPLVTQYWENQCMPHLTSSSCSLEEFSNFTMCCADNAFQNLTQLQCQLRCDNETTFTCRGFTYIPAQGNDSAQCFLHSDDTSSMGPRALQALYGATYWERVSCLNLDVACTPAAMQVTLHSQQFSGRLYVQTRSETCNTQGRQGRDAVLKIPLSSRSGRDMNPCGVMVAHSVGESNRTLVSTVVIVQYNPIIQRRGDRAVKVGCLLDSAAPGNVTVGASLSFSSAEGINGGATVVVNQTAVSPTVSLRIVDLGEDGRELQEVVVGQSLELRIEVSPENSTYDIHAFDLVATSQDGAQSYFLLDQRGCPSDIQTFPALRRLHPGSRTLVGDFRAFKFPRSDVVRFSANVHICPGTCPAVDCGGGVTSLGRRRRQALPPPDSMFRELPLQLVITVRSRDVQASSLATEDADFHNHIIFQPNIDDEFVCMSWGLLLGLALAWILLQFLIIGVWYGVLHWRRRPPAPDQLRLQDDFPESDGRRVHWADQQS